MMTGGINFDKNTDLDSPIHRLDSRTKLLYISSLIVFSVCMPANAFAGFFACFVFLVCLSALSQIPFTHLLKRSVVILPFITTIALLAAVNSILAHRLNALFLVGVLIKSYLAVLSLILLSSTTPFPKLLHGLRRLGLPLILAQIGELVYRYLATLSHELERMKRARDARCFESRSLWQAKVIGQIVGAFFLRSVDRSQRIYWAMVSRGFGSTQTLPINTSFCAFDGVFIAGTFVFLYILKITA
jgi:cobalt/nickel transport system permease protein